MTDLHKRAGDFKGISRDEGGALCRGAVHIINSYASYIVAISCDTEEVARQLPTRAMPETGLLLELARSPYNAGLHWTMGALAGLIGRPDERIQYWFEAGDEYQSATKRFLAALKMNSTPLQALRRHYSYGSDAFASKSSVRLFEIPDLVAWEWGKHVECVREGKPLRPSLRSLMDDSDCIVSGQPFHQSATRYANHLGGGPMRHFFERMGDLMIATTREQVDEVIARKYRPDS